PQASEAVGDRRADRLQGAGIEGEVRVARWVHVAERPVDATGWDLEQGQALRGLDDTRGAAEQSRVAAALDDRIDPGVFLEAVADEDLGALDEQDLARPDLEVVGILSGAGRDLDPSEIAHDGARDRPEIGERGQHAKGGLRGQFGRREREENAADQDDGQREAQREAMRRAHQKRSVGWAPRMNVPWRKNSLATRSTAPVPSLCLYWTRKRRNSEGLNWR